MDTKVTAANALFTLKDKQMQEQPEKGLKDIIIQQQSQNKEMQGTKPEGRRELPKQVLEVQR